MLLTLTTTHHPATDLGYLLAKSPARCQTFSLNFGRAHVFYNDGFLRMIHTCPSGRRLSCRACANIAGIPKRFGRGKYPGFVAVFR